MTCRVGNRGRGRSGEDPFDFQLLVPFFTFGYLLGESRTSVPSNLP
jgi:hypothetical protein